MTKKQRRSSRKAMLNRSHMSSQKGCYLYDANGYSEREVLDLQWGRHFYKLEKQGLSRLGNPVQK